MSDRIQIGDFKIERQIGAGGMGVVYLATQVSLNRRVALKVIGPSLTRKSDIARFQREARAVAKLNHPNIASVYFVGQDKNLCYLAMEFIDGVSLRSAIENLSLTNKPDSRIDQAFGLPEPEKQKEIFRFDEPTETQDLGPAPTVDLVGQPDLLNPYRTPQAEQAITTKRHVRRCAEIVKDVALALQHAHENGVIHRDLKPDNLMLDRRGQVHVIDFGVARFLEDATLTRTGALIGTPRYMSPEQVTGRIELDHRTDIYSLGIVLYELLVLRQPIAAGRRDSILRNIVTKALRPVSKLNSSVPDSLQNVVHKATSKDPDERFQSSSEMADDLDRFLSGDQVLAPRYRFSIDESEIRATRPAGISVIGNLLFAASMILAFFSTIEIANINEVPHQRAGRLIASLMTLMCAVLGALGGWGLISGRSWGRVLATLLLLSAAIFFFYEGSTSLPDNVAFKRTFFTIGACFAGLSMLPLMGKKSSDWFDFTRRVRGGEAEEKADAKP